MQRAIQNAEMPSVVERCRRRGMMLLAASSTAYARGQLEQLPDENEEEAHERRAIWQERGRLYHLRALIFLDAANAGPGAAEKAMTPELGMNLVTGRDIEI